MVVGALKRTALQWLMLQLELYKSLNLSLLKINKFVLVVLQKTLPFPTQTLTQLYVIDGLHVRKIPLMVMIMVTTF